MQDLSVTLVQTSLFWEAIETVTSSFRDLLDFRNKFMVRLDADDFSLK